MELELKGNEVYNAQLELLIKILATNKAIGSFLSDKFSKTQNESDELYKSFVEDSNHFADEILKDLYERGGNIDLNDLLSRK